MYIHIYVQYVYVIQVCKLSREYNRTCNIVGVSVVVGTTAAKCRNRRTKQAEPRRIGNYNLPNRTEPNRIMVKSSGTGTNRTES